MKYYIRISKFYMNEVVTYSVIQHITLKNTTNNAISKFQKAKEKKKKRKKRKKSQKIKKTITQVFKKY